MRHRRRHFRHVEVLFFVLIFILFARGFANGRLLLRRGFRLRSGFSRLLLGLWRRRRFVLVWIFRRFRLLTKSKWKYKQGRQYRAEQFFHVHSRKRISAPALDPFASGRNCTPNGSGTIRRSIIASLQHNQAGIILKVAAAVLRCTANQPLHQSLRSASGAFRAQLESDSLPQTLPDEHCRPQPDPSVKSSNLSPFSMSTSPS